MTTTPETIEFAPVTEYEPSAAALLYGLAGVLEAIDYLTGCGESDVNLLGNLGTAGSRVATTPGGSVNRIRARRSNARPGRLFAAAFPKTVFEFWG